MFREHILRAWILVKRADSGKWHLDGSGDVSPKPPSDAGRSGRLSALPQLRTC